MCYFTNNSLFDFFCLVMKYSLVLDLIFHTNLISWPDFVCLTFNIAVIVLPFYNILKAVIVTF